jgi:hypothetical protein
VHFRQLLSEVRAGRSDCRSATVSQYFFAPVTADQRNSVAAATPLAPGDGAISLGDGNKPGPEGGVGLLVAVRLGVGVGLGDRVVGARLGVGVDDGPGVTVPQPVDGGMHPPPQHSTVPSVRTPQL